ncbi:MAG: ABC transporter ATP-binding protein [Polyangiaceae bacterium]|jgi:NitT/TauT family transport system ATP-binding protein
MLERTGAVHRTPSSVAAEAAQIEVRDVDKTYGVGRAAREVVKGCSFTIDRNKFTVMIGPSGVGKSTLIRLIAGFEKPTRGEILVGGKRVDRPGHDRLVMFQETALFPWMTTTDNVLYGPKARGECTPLVKDVASRLIDKVGLGAFRAKYPSQLSGGMQRRAELARALINKPSVMILDEPFRGLDAMTKKLMLEYYAGLWEEARPTHMFVTTDIDEAIFLADRLLVMSHIPTRVRAVLDVDLPRPRSLTAIVDDDRANALKMEALMLLHEEAQKSFAAGSRAVADFVEAYRRRMATGSPR